MKTDLNSKILDLKIKINRARYNIIFIILLSIINLVTVYLNGAAIIPFSCSMATISMLFGYMLSTEQGNEAFLIICLSLAILILLALFVCYIKSKKNGFLLVSALSIIIVDTIVLIIITFSPLGAILQFNPIVDIIMHLVSIIYVAIGVKAFKTLNTAPFCEPQEHEEEEEEEEGATDEPIRKYEDNGAEPIVIGEYEDYNVFTVIKDGIAELVINGFVCDALECAYTSEFELRAIVNDIDFIFQYRRDYERETAFLYADDVLLDSVNNEI